MNEVLKIGIIWVLCSIPMIYFLHPTLIRSFIVGNIGIVLVVVGLIIEEYMAYKFEKTINL